MRDRRGIIAIMLGLLALPLMGIVGLAVDYGFATRAQALLNSAADSAAVAATEAASNAFANNMQVNGVSDFISVGSSAGQQAFNAQVANIPNVTVQPVSVNVSQVPGSSSFISIVAYTASYQTWFGVLFGVATFPLSGGATAQITLKAYEDFHILMDVSGSMEIAATSAGMAALGPLALAADKASQFPAGSGICILGAKAMCNEAQNTNCAFACHSDNSGKPGINDFYELAKQQGIQVRLDVELQAVSNVIGTMSTQDANMQYRVGVYTFANGLTQPLTYPLSSDLSSGATAAANVQEPWQNPGSEPDTNFGAAMTSLATIIPTPGDGTTQAAPQEFLFVITDGIEDYCTNTTCQPGNGRIQVPIAPGECSALKAEGVQILVLYVQYVPLDTSYNGINYSNNWYKTYIQQYVDPGGVVSSTNTVQTNLQACASSSAFFFYAADSTQIQAQLTAMLLAAENQGVRLVR